MNWSYLRIGAVTAALIMGPPPMPEILKLAEKRLYQEKITVSTDRTYANPNSPNSNSSYSIEFFLSSNIGSMTDQEALFSASQGKFTSGVIYPRSTKNAEAYEESRNEGLEYPLAIITFSDGFCVQYSPEILENGDIDTLPFKYAKDEFHKMLDELSKIVHGLSNSKPTKDSISELVA